MAKIESWFVCDLKKAVQVQVLNGNVFSLDNNGSRIGVKIFDGGEKATVSGAITANCVLPDGSTVNVNGTLTTVDGQSVGYIDVPQGCLLITGPLKITIKLTDSGVITTLAAILTTVYQTKTDNVITPSAQIINDWNAQISAAIATQNAAIANQDTKINDLKSALTFNKFDKTTVESGYYLGYYGNKVSDASSFCSDYIDVSEASKANIIPQFQTSLAYNIFYDEFKQPIESHLINESVTSFDIPPYVKYIRITGLTSKIDSTVVELEYGESVGDNEQFRNIQAVYAENHVIKVDWTQCNIKGNGGLEYKAKNITTVPFEINPFNEVTVTVPSGYSVLYATYNSNGVMEDATGWKTSNFKIPYTSGKLYRLCAKHGTSDILPSEGDNIVITARSIIDENKLIKLTFDSGKHMPLRGCWNAQGKWVDGNYYTVSGFEYTKLFIKLASGYKAYPTYFTNAWEFSSNDSNNAEGMFAPSGTKYGFSIVKTDSAAFDFADCGLEIYCLIDEYEANYNISSKYDTKNGKHSAIKGFLSSQQAWQNGGVYSRGYYIPNGIIVDCNPVYGIIPVYLNENGTFISQSAKYVHGFFKPTVSPYVDFIVAPYSGSSITVEDAKFEAYSVYPTIPDDDAFVCAPIKYTEINRTQHGNTKYIRIPSLCVLNDHQTLVMYELRNGSAADETESDIGYSLVNNLGEIVSFGVAFERKEDETRCFNPQLINDGTKIMTLFSTQTTGDNIRIYYSESTDGLTWDTPIMLENTTLNDSKMMTSPANPIIFGGELVCPIYISDEIISATGEGYYSGLMVYDPSNNSFDAKVCNVEGTNECQVVDVGDYIMLVCRNNITYKVNVFLTTASMESAFTESKSLLTPEVTHVNCQETYKRIGKDIFICRPLVTGRKNVAVAHANIDGKIEQFDFIASHAGKTCGGYSSLDSNKKKFVMCCEDSETGGLGHMITVCAFAKTLV